MKTRANKPLHLPLLVVGLVAILVSGITIASVVISDRGSDGAFAPGEAAETVAAPVLAAGGVGAVRCAECGVIESTREIVDLDQKSGICARGWTTAEKRGVIRAKPLPNYEITIRLKDGSTRVITDAKPAKWRHGEPVTIIAGMN